MMHLTSGVLGRHLIPMLTSNDLKNARESQQRAAAAELDAEGKKKIENARKKLKTCIQRETNFDRKHVNIRDRGDETYQKYLKKCKQLSTAKKDAQNELQRVIDEVSHAYINTL